MQRTGRDAWRRLIELPETSPHTVHRLKVSLSSLYPLEVTELNGDLDPAAFRTLKNWVRLEWDGQRLTDEPLTPVPWSTRRVITQPAELTASGRPALAGVIAIRREAPQPVIARPEPWGGARITWTPVAAMQGHSFPLATSGQPGAGNTLFCRLQPGGALVIGYDHWGKPSIASAPIPFPLGVTHTIEFWMPALVSAERATPVVVRLDGHTVWTAAVPFYPPTPTERFLLRNAIGASSSEPTLPNARIEARGLPHPLSPTP